jgi:predicted NUDIX family NTP pyrophosphohydrolase
VKPTSAGILGWREGEGGLEVLLVHPGGPFFARKDAGAWSIPKGELEPGEDPLAAALRELEEETGWTLPVPPEVLSLGTVTQRSGKVVHGFAARLEVDPETIRPGMFSMEWPRGSGVLRSFPEVDRAAYFVPLEAKKRINAGQVPLIERLLVALGAAVPW